MPFTRPGYHKEHLEQPLRALNYKGPPKNISVPDHWKQRLRKRVLFNSDDEEEGRQWMNNHFKLFQARLDLESMEEGTK